MNSETSIVLKSRFFWKLFFSFTAVFSITIASVFFYLLPNVEKSLKKDLENKLINKIELLKGSFEVVDISTANAALVDKLVDDLSRKNFVQLLVVNSKKSVVGDSLSQDLHRDVSYLPEFIQADQLPYSKIEKRDDNGIWTLYLVQPITNGYIRVGMSLDAVSQTKVIVMQGVLYSFIPALFLAALLGFMLARRYTSSINELLDISQLIARGHFTARYHGESDDEIDTLGHVINSIATNLKERLDELTQEKQHLSAILDGMLEGVLVVNQKGEVILANQALLHLFSTQTLYQGRGVLECFRNNELHSLISGVLESAQPSIKKFDMQQIDGERYLLVHAAPLSNQGDLMGVVAVVSDISDVRKLETFRREFVANVSHELKTPLTNIIGYSETLESALDDPNMSKRFLEKILKNASQLKLLVDDLLDLSAIESGRMQYKKTMVALKPLLMAIRSDYTDSIVSKKLSLEVDIPDDLMVQADEQSLKQIFRNLLDNAIKYTPENGHVSLYTREADSHIKVVVRDTGIGVDEKDLKRIYERFFRAEQSRSRDMGGTGLGLSIVKHLVSAMGWDIEVRSKLGEGTEFTLLIPKN